MTDEEIVEKFREILLEDAEDETFRMKVKLSKEMSELVDCARIACWDANAVITCLRTLGIKEIDLKSAYILINGEWDD